MSYKEFMEKEAVVRGYLNITSKSTTERIIKEMATKEMIVDIRSNIILGTYKVYSFDVVFIDFAISKTYEMASNENMRKAVIEAAYLALTDESDLNARI